MNITKLPPISAIILIAIVLFSCQAYYKTTRVIPASSAKSVDSLKKENRYFVLRNGDEAFYIKSIVLSDDQLVL